MPKSKEQFTFKATNVIEMRLQYSGGLQFKKALVNGVKLAFAGGVARFGIREDAGHVLQWEVVGFVGTKWSFKLTTDTDGYEVTQKVLSNPGKSFELKDTSEKQEFKFTVAKTKESANA